MRAKVLLVDDEIDVIEPLKFNLERDGFEVDCARSANEALSKIAAAKPDIILLDIMLPDISGTSLANQLKNDPATSAVPIILLTARDSETDIVVGLSMGADDYVTKPFSTQVLAARIDAALRRSAQQGGLSAKGQIVKGALKLVPENFTAYVNNEPIELTNAEFKILLALIKAGGAILSREQLKDEFGGDASVTERNIDVHIAALRRKLGPAREMIKTVHRLGYRFE